MTHVDALPLADTSDMIGMHRVFRQALAAASELVGHATPGDADRAAVVGTYYDNVLRLLDVHHASEDQLLRPKLLERLPDEADTITGIFAQHADVEGAIDRVHTCLAAWRTDPTAPSATALEVALAELDAALTPHLDQEERTVLPLAARCINVAEWGELPGHGMSHFTGDKQWLIRGLISDQMTPAQRTQMEAHTPPPIAAMWNETGHAAYADFLVQLRGTAVDPQPIGKSHHT